MPQSSQVSMFGHRHRTRFSRDRVYRYWLEADVNPSGTGSCMFLMLNPSTADEEFSDPTVTRCKTYAASWGFSTLVVCNLFALRSTDPTGLKEVDDPIGPENDQAILDAGRDAVLIVCAWGVHGAYMNRGNCVLKTLENAVLGGKIGYLKLTKDGHPSHPLYLPSGLKPELGLPYS